MMMFFTVYSKTALESLRIDFKGWVVGQVGESARNALEASKNALKTQINRIGELPNIYNRQKRIWIGIAIFGILAVLVCL